jgi:hypothetical protein
MMRRDADETCQNLRMDRHSWMRRDAFGTDQVAVWQRFMFGAQGRWH